MSTEDQLARREHDLATRDAELDRREAQLEQREAALAGLAAEIAAERERVGRARGELLRELHSASIRNRRSSAYAVAGPAAPEPDKSNDAWWAKVLGRGPAA